MSQAIMLKLQSIRSDERILKPKLKFGSLFGCILLQSIRSDERILKPICSGVRAKEYPLQSIRSDERILKAKPSTATQRQTSRVAINSIRWEDTERIAFCSTVSATSSGLQSIRSDERILKESVVQSDCIIVLYGCNQFDPMRGYWKINEARWAQPAWMIVAINSIRWEDTESLLPLHAVTLRSLCCNQFDPMRGYWKRETSVPSAIVNHALQSIRSDERILKGGKEVTYGDSWVSLLQSIRSDERILKGEQVPVPPAIPFLLQSIRSDERILKVS